MDEVPDVEIVGAPDLRARFLDDPVPVVDLLDTFEYVGGIDQEGVFGAVLAAEQSVDIA
ncbi:hypothetical protein [Nocardia sp. CA-119907]|uniref:hypothetical protein n=1 Tax=Nocardia sp. CA-119907 TaxID=3239973 RepID=UPI003D9974B7